MCGWSLICAERIWRKRFLRLIVSWMKRFLPDLGQVYIIHGKGTGVLRTGISEFLRRHKHVKSYRLGNYGEGGTGVTVAELK